jgi:hypothetical protein
VKIGIGTILRRQWNKQDIRIDDIYLAVEENSGQYVLFCDYTDLHEQKKEKIAWFMLEDLIKRMQLYRPESEKMAERYHKAIESLNKPTVVEEICGLG